MIVSEPTTTRSKRPSHIRTQGVSSKVDAETLYYQNPHVQVKKSRASDTCILLEVGAVSFQNKTDSKALLYSSISCQEPPFRGLIPGESADTMLNSARSVRFEFA